LHGGCHTVDHPANGTHLETTSTERAGGSYATEWIVCQVCHMWSGPGVVGPGRETACTGGLETWGLTVTCLGTSVPIEKALDVAIEHAASAVLISTIITHGDVHRDMMQKLSDLAEEKGVREKLLLIAGGTQVTDEIACTSGMDAGFGRRTKGLAVASFIVREMRERGL